MASENWALLLLFISLISAFPNLSSEVVQEGKDTEEVGLLNRKVGHRALMGFKEMPNGGNVTYDCSPSGPCVPCVYSEKSRETYRCSETGYRIPLKCVEVESHSVEEDKSRKTPNDRSTLQSTVNEVKLGANAYPPKDLNSSTTKRSLMDAPPTGMNGRQPYITYRSCIPAVNEEKLSVLGFEEIMVGLLILSGSAIYFRRKNTNAVPSGHVRVPNNSRF